MKCVFKDIDCARGGRSHDDCRRCRHAPYMTAHDSTEMHILCAVAGQREKQKKCYGYFSSAQPRWLKAIIKKNDGYGDNIPCTDHRRYLDQQVINEPYNVDMSEMKELIEFCEKENLSFMIDGDSVHFPGRCFRIIITKPKKTKRELVP